MSSFLFRFHDLIGGIHVPIDDAVDKLNRKYTLLIFLFLALPIFTKQYIGEPIECFTPTYFTEAQARYVNSYCWTSSNYYIVTEEGEDTAAEDLLDVAHQPIMLEDLDYGGPIVADLGAHRIRRIRVGYYQWAPLILLVQGFCFHLPFVLWGACAHNAGVKLRRLLKRASDIAALPPGCQQREALLAEFVDQFHSLVSGNGGGCCDDPSCRFPPLYRCLSGPSRYLCLLYLVVKGLYVLNVGFQFLLLTMFMGRGFVRHGFDLLRKLATEGEWWNSPRFPLQTLCKVRAANQGGLRTNICRCVLPINVFNEKIFSVVWFYLAILLPLNAAGLILWAWRTLPWNRMAFVRLTLWRTRMVGMAELSRVARKISLSYLGWDGVFVLRLIEHNHGSNMATLILGRMWEFYSTQMKTDDCDAEAGPSSCPPPPPPHAGTSSSTWSHCACHVPHYGQHPTMHPKRTTSAHQHDGFWEKCS